MAEGFVLSITPTMLKRLDEADAKISKLQTTSDKTSSKIIDDFRRMATGVDPFINKLKEAQSLLSKMSSPNISIKGFKETATDGEKAAKATASITESLNKIKSNPIDDINKKIASLKELLNQATRSVEEYSRKMASVKSTGSGMISGTTIKEGGAGAALIPQIQGQIAALEQEKKSISSSQVLWQQRLDSLNNSSLATQRQVSDLAKLNESFRTGQSELQKQAKAQDDLAKAAEKSAAAADKQAAAEAKRNAQAQKKSDTSAERALEKYNNALNKSEVTIANRARKIEALANAERALTKTGRDYTLELAKIRTETERLNKANVDAANSVGKIKNSQSTLIDTSSQLKRQLALVFSVSQIEGYIMKMVNIRGEFELQQRALQAILQNKDEANKLFGQITELAVKSPFRVKELVTYTKQLAAYRIETSNLYDTTKMLADVSSGLGVDMQRLILAFGQVKAANYLRGTELRQFSEAGINILGELSTYFTELEGQMVSVGDVFERVSNRMVSFGDVEEIFKRITSAGGIFYNMQEIQAETLQGQISNLYDSIDLMFNDIGKANDGVLKDVVGAIRSMVENWEVLAVILKASSVGFSLYTAKVIMATIANKGFSASQIEATIKTKGLTKALAKTVVAFRAIGSFIKANPYILLATAIAAVGYSLYDNARKVEDIKKKYDILNGSLDTSSDKLNKLVTDINSQSDIIEKTSASLDKAKKGTEEYNKAQEQHNEAQKKHRSLLELLKREYPEVYAQIVNQKNSTEALSKAQKNYNEQLEKTKLLNYQMRQKEPLFGAGFTETGDDRIQSFDEEKKASEKMKLAYEDLSSELSFYLKTNKFVSKNTKKEVQDILNSSAKIEDKVPSLRKALRFTRGVGDALPSDFRTQFSELEKTASAYRDANKEVSNSATEMASWIDTMIDASLKNIGKTREEFSKLDDESKKGFVKTIQDFLLSKTENKRLLLFSKNIIKQKIGVEIDIDKKTIKSDFSDVQKELQKGIDKINKDTNTHLKPISIDERVEDYADNLYKQATELEESAKRAERATKALSSTKSNVDLAKSYREQAKAMKELAIEYGASSKKDLNEEETEYEKRLKSQLELLKKIQSQYEKLKGYQSEEDVAKNLQETFGAVFEKTFSKPITSIKFDKASIAREAEDIGKTIVGKSAISLSKSFNEYASLLRSDIVIGVSLERTDELKSEIEDLFSGYELSLELEKLNIPPELAKKLFNVDVFNLDELQKKAAPYLAELRAQGGNQIKVADDIEKKISDMQEKANLERIKTYSKYLQQTMSERVNVELETLRKIEEINKIESFTPEQKKEATEQVKKESVKKLDKLEFESFKEDDLYIKMFEDLDKVSTSMLTTMRERLISLKSSLKDLSPTELKEIASQTQKIDDAIQERNPFKELIPNIKEYISYLKTRNETEEAYKEESAKILPLQEKSRKADTNLAGAQQEYNLAVKTYGVNSKQAQNAKLVLLTRKQIATKAKTELSDQQKVTNELGKQVNKGREVGEAIKAAFGKAGGYATDLSNAIGEVAAPLESMFGTMSGSTKDALESTQEILGGVGEMASGIASGNYLQAAIGAIKTIGAIFAIGDKKKERQIQAEIDKVNELSSVYEDLNRIVEKGYSTAIFETGSKRVKILQEQIDSYKKMIESEKSKKKTDDARIKEWQNEIKTLNYEIEDVYSDMKDELFGTFKSLSQELGDSIIEAFKAGETAADSWGKTVDEIVANIIKKILIAKMIEPQIAKLIDDAMVKAMPQATQTERLRQEMLNAQGELEKIKDGIMTNSQRRKREEAERKYSEALKAYTKSVEAGEGEIPNINEEIADFLKEGLTGIGESFADLPDFLKDLLQSSSQGELEGLQRGIQGVTEETAQILESLLNSMRFFVADSNTQIKNIYALFSNSDAPNPILSELKAQTMLVRSIYDLFNGMTTPHTTYGKRSLICTI